MGTTIHNPKSEIVRVLLIEDNPADARLIRELLAEAGATKFSLEVTERLSVGLARLAHDGIDVILADLGLQDSQGLETLAKVRTQAPQVPIILLTGLDDERLAVQAVQEGAQDYLVKGQVDSAALARAIRYAIERKRAEEEIKQRNHELAILNALAAVVSQSLNLNEILKASLDKVLDLMHLDAGGIYLADPERRKLNLVVHQGVSKEYAHEVESVSVDEKTLEAVAAEGRLRRFILSVQAVMKDRAEIQKVMSAMRKEGLSLTSGIPVLLQAKEEILGLMVVISRAPWQFSEAELQLLSSIGQQIAVAIQNVRLYDAVQRELTERKHAEEALAEERRKLKKAEAIGKLGHWEYDIETQKIVWSDEVYALYERDPSLGPPTAEEEAKYYPAEQARILRDYAARAIQTGESFEYDLVAELPSGRKAYFSASMQPIKNAQGRVARLFGTVQDITARKRAENALRASEERFRSILDNIEDGYYEVDTAGNFTFFNPALVRMLGRPEHELMGMNNRLYMTPEGSKAVFQTFNRVFRTGIPEQAFDWELVRPDGTRRSVEVSVSLIQAANGSIEGFRGIVRDITARKQAEEALRAGEDRYRDLVENSHDLISTHDLQGQILSVNPAVAKLTGYTQSESVEMNLRDFMASEVRDGLETYLATIRKHGAASGLIRIQTRSGERRIWEYHNTLRVEGVPAPIVRSMARDVTERVRAEKALRASEKRFRALIENSSDAIVLLTADHTILYSSVANPPVLGFEPSEVVGQRLLDWIHPEDVSSMADLLGKVQQEPNTRVHAECRCRHKDGSWRWVEGTIYNLLAEPSVQAIGINYHDITERKRAEIALENSEARYRSLVETAGAGVATTDLEGNFTFVNQALCDMLGYRSEELLDKPFADFLHPDDVEGILQIFLNAFQNPTRKPQLEFRAIHKDGHAVYCYSNPTILWHEGQIAGFNAVILDVTARKRAEEALAQERNLLRTLIDNLPDRIYAKDVETRFILNNAAHLRALGVPAQEEALGKTDFDFRPREIAERHAADDQAVIQSGEPLLNREEPTVLPTGETGWLLTTKVPLRDPQGRVIGLVGISRDITKRKRAEEALRETQQTLEAVIQASPLPILALNRDGSVKMWNPAAERTFGWNAEQVLGRQNPSVPGEKLEESDAMFLRVLGGSGFSGVETRRQRKDGSLIDVSISTAPLRDGRGSINGIMAVVADITERKQAEAAIRRRNEELAALNQVGRTLSKLAESHEILDLIYKTIGQVLDNDNFYIALYDEASQQISFPIYTIEGQRHARDTRAFANGITEYVIRTKAPLFIPSHHDQTLARLGIDQMSRPSQCLLAVPMLVGDKAIGVITVQDYARENVYDTAHVELLSTFAAQAAIALENARLFAETQRRADEFAALYDTTRDLAAQQDLPILLDTIVERAMRLFAVPAAGVSLYDPTRGDLERVVAKGYTPPPERRVPLGEGMIGRVAQTRQPLIIDNYQTWAGRSPRYENIPITSNMQVPMLHRGELIGVLGVSEIAPGRREFTETDVRLLSLFAAQAASAVHSTRLLTETQSRARQLEGLYQIGQTINGTLEMETILETVVDEAMRVSGAQLGFIAVVDQTTQRFIYRALRGYTPERQARTEEKSQSLSEGLNGRAYHTRQVVQISDVRQATDYLSRFSETRTELVVPMIRGDRVIGNIDLQSPRVGAFDGADLSFLRALADEAAIALENARLFKETHQRAQRQAALYQISTTLARVRGVQETCEAVARAMRDALNYPNLEIFLLDPKTGDRVLQVQFGADNVQKNWRIPPGEGVSEKAILTGKLQYWRDVTREPRYVPALRDSRSEVDVPIKINDSVLGVLIVEDTGVDAFNAEDFDVLQTVANQLAVALENARLFGETRQRLDELEAINKVSTALRAATALEEMFPLLLDEALNLLKTDIGILSLYDPESDALHRVVARGMPEDTPRVPIRPGEGIMGQVFATGEAHVSREYVNDPLLFETTRDRAKVGWGGVCVPVRTAEEVIGVLSVSVPLPREITPVEVHLLTTLAEMAGNAIHRMRLHEQTERRLERLTALRAVDTAIVSSFDLGFTLNVLVNHIITQLEVDAASILLFNEHTQILEYAAGRGFRTKGIERSHLRLGEGYAGRAALERRVTSCPDLREVGNARARLRLLAGEGFVAYFGVPLIAKGQIKGVLDIFHRTSLNPDQEWLGFLETLAGQAALAIDNAELFNHLQRANTELSLAYDATIEGWSHALDLRDRETEGHTRRVAEMTVQLAQMIGVSKEELVHIRRGALLHDIGKMGTPDNILHKPGPLTDAEWEIMHQHPVYAYEFLSPIVYLRPALDIPHCHHEKWDGTGYPRGLAAEQIPLAARIFAVVDVWDALRSDRPYRSAWAEEQVLEYLRDQVGKHFDPKVAEAFLRLVG